MSKRHRAPQARRFVALNLKYARMMLGWTQEQLAEASGLDRKHIGLIERGKGGASIDSLAKLAGAVGVLPHVLLMPPAEGQPLMLAASSDRKKATKKGR